MTALYHLGFGRAQLTANPPTLAVLCGDPHRAQQIAQHTAGVHCLATLSENRGLNSYLCQLDGGPQFLSCTSGMGAPSLSIVVNELCQLGVSTIIRIGTCGALQPDIKAGDLVISQAALCDQGAANDIAPVNYPAVADPYLTIDLVTAARSHGFTHHLGLTASTDTFFEGQGRTADSVNRHLQPHLQQRCETYRALNILNFEMEAATLFKMGSVYGFKAAAICAVLAERQQSEQICHQVKELAVSQAITCALTVVRQHAT